jgi:hypothetical protein
MVVCRKTLNDYTHAQIAKNSSKNSSIHKATGNWKKAKRKYPTEL